MQPGEVVRLAWTVVPSELLTRLADDRSRTDETDRYDFHQSRVEFPYTLSLRRFDWARERDAVLTDVSVQGIDFDTLAEESVPDDWNCEENDSSPDCGRFDESS